MSNKLNHKEINSKENISPQREYWIDVIRSFACLCVVVGHTAISGGTKGLYWIPIFNYLSVSGASILFFMISGALVLYKPKELTSFIKTRLTRIVLPMVIWTIITLVIDVINGDLCGTEFWHKIIKIPFYPQVGIYWFIYTIFGIYLITPILSTWLNTINEKQLRIYLIIWGVTLFLPYVTLWDEKMDKIIGYSGGYLYSFYGYTWYAVMGYYIRKYINIKKVKMRYIIIPVILLVIPGILYYIGCPHNMVHDRQTINVVALCIFYFVVLKHLKYSLWFKRVCYNFAQHTFGIYLVHMLFLKLLFHPFVKEYMLDMNYFFIIIIIAIATIITSYITIHLISKLPFSKYIVAF